jgi:hypothetical protein
MAVAMNWQLQINLEFYVQNIDVKDNSSNVFIQYLLFCNESVLNMILIKFGHILHIVSTHIQKL